MKLTGKTRYRVGREGPFRAPVLVLQVQFSYRRMNNYGRYIEGEDAIEWRDARVEDLPPLAG